MIVLLLLALAAALVAIVAFAYRAKQRDQTPEDLRGDWWSRFEADFREYARRCDIAGGARRKHRDGRVRQQRFPRGRDLSF